MIKVNNFPRWDNYVRARLLVLLCRFREPLAPEPTEETDIYIGSGDIPDEITGIGKSEEEIRCIFEDI